jgi:thiol-disulfide isomerase/thioredoxin
MVYTPFKKVTTLHRMKRSIVLVVLIVILVVIYLNVDEGFQGAGPLVVICKADWCGHCKKAAPEFQKLTSASPIALSNGTQASVKILDADQDKEEIKKYNVRGYPSILIVNGSDTTEYPGERTYDGVIEFLNQM